MSKFLQYVLGTAVEIVILSLALGVFYKMWGIVLGMPQRQKVLSFQEGIVMYGGDVERVLRAGNYWISSRKLVVLCDMRPRPFEVPVQYLNSAEGQLFRLSLSGEYRVVDSTSFVTTSSDAFGALFIEIKHALRLAAAEMNSDQILGEQGALAGRAKELVVPRSSQLGLELTQLSLWEIFPLVALSQS